MDWKTLFIFMCSNSQDLQKEEEAIKQAIVNANQAALNRDYNEWQKWIYQDESYYMLTSRKSRFFEISGWDELSKWAQEVAKDGPRKGPKSNLFNFHFKISGDMAFATFESEESKQTRVMIKEDGIWKELYVGIVNTKSYKDDQSKENKNE